MDIDNLKAHVIYCGLPTGFQGSTFFFFISYVLCLWMIQAFSNEKQEGHQSVIYH